MSDVDTRERTRSDEPKPHLPGAAEAGSLAGERSTAALARFVCGTNFADIPAAIVAATKALILDEIVVTAAAFDTPMAQALLRLKAEQGGEPEATLMVDGRKVPAPSAAYVHGQLANLLDADETMHNRMHTLSASVMAGLAMAEKLGSSGQDLIAAVATGYDITARVGISLRQYVSDGKGGMLFAPLYGWSWMSFGAAATAGRLLGLDPAQLAHAMGQAYVTTPVYFDIGKLNRRLMTAEKPAAWHKYQMSGAMAEAGVNAALLASFGWLAQEDVLDEGSSFWQSFAAPACDWDALYNELGQRWYIGETSIKPYPFCRFGHAALDIFSGIVRKHGLQASDLDDVLIRIVPHALSEMLVQIVGADEPLKLMVSEPTALALIASGIRPGPRWFSPAALTPKIAELARRIRYEVVHERGAILLEQAKADGFFSRVPTEIVVRTVKGVEHRGYAEYALGDPWSAASRMTYRDVAEKARGFLDGILPGAQIERLIDAVDGLEDGSRSVAAVAEATVRSTGRH